MWNRVTRPPWNSNSQKRLISTGTPLPAPVARWRTSVSMWLSSGSLTSTSSTSIEPQASFQAPTISR